MKKILLLLGCFFILGCKNQKKVELSEEIQINEKVYQWFYFTEGTVKSAEKLSEIPAYPFKPWTQSAEITAMSSAASSIDGSVPEAYAVVNRCGILCFKDDDFELFADSGYFKGKCAENLFFYDDTPFFTVTRNTFFTEADKTVKTGQNAFLVQLDKKQKIFYPVLTAENIGYGDSDEITGFVYDGKSFTGEIKSVKNDRIGFDYFNIQLKDNLLSLSPETAEKSIYVSHPDSSVYRKAWEPASYSKMPERAAKLLKTLPENISLDVQVLNAGGHFPRTYEKNPSENPLNAAVILSENWAACLFEDGTFYINGSLYGKPLINDGKTVVLRLPALPSGFRYGGGHFAISGNCLYASWEEASFHETGRSGFIRIDLGKIFYD